MKSWMISESVTMENFGWAKRLARNSSRAGCFFIIRSSTESFYILFESKLVSMDKCKKG